jgi:hypothetical protein
MIKSSIAVVHAVGHTAAILLRARPRETNKSAEILKRSRSLRTIVMLKSRLPVKTSLTRLNPCFHENFASLSIANNRGPAEASDGHAGFCCIGSHHLAFLTMRT